MGNAFKGRENRSHGCTVRMDAEKHIEVRKHADSKGSNKEVKRTDDQVSNGAGLE